MMPRPTTNWRNCKRRDFSLLQIWSLFEKDWPPSTAKPRRRISPIRLRENECASSPICRGAWDFPFTHSSEVFWSIMASSCIILPRAPFSTSRVMLLYANYFWVLRPILNCGESCSSLSRAITKDQYLKWGEPKYGVLLRPDTYPACRRRRLKSGPLSDFTLMTSYFQIQSGEASPSLRVSL